MVAQMPKMCSLLMLLQSYDACRLLATTTDRLRCSQQHFGTALQQG